MRIIALSDPTIFGMSDQAAIALILGSALIILGVLGYEMRDRREHERREAERKLKQLEIKYERDTDLRLWRQQVNGALEEIRAYLNRRREVWLANDAETLLHGNPVDWGTHLDLAQRWIARQELEDLSRAQVLTLVETLDANARSGHLDPWERSKVHAYLADLNGELARRDTMALAAETALTTRTVLVVEDEPHALELARHSLQIAGYEVQTATTAEEALTLLHRACCPDLILLDLRLPGMSGLELARRLRESVITGAIPLVALTGSEATEREALDAGCDAYISKPYSPLSLGARLADVLAHA